MSLTWWRCFGVTRIDAANARGSFQGVGLLSGVQRYLGTGAGHKTSCGWGVGIRISLA